VADLDRINRSQAHLLGIINDILQFAKLEVGQLEIKLEDFPVDAALSVAEELVNPQLESRQLAYEYVHGDESVSIRADRDRFQQIVLNLLSNAIKFTPEKGTISVRWRLSGNTVVIDVADTGIGIDAAQLERIFDPFVQVHSGTTRTSEGVGLGLAISRDMARQMGGEIVVRSRFGEGSTFSLVLPRGA
jgi:signal transduction histidine kinase